MEARRPHQLERRGAGRGGRRERGKHVWRTRARGTEEAAQEPPRRRCAGRLAGETDPQLKPAAASSSCKPSCCPSRTDGPGQSIAPPSRKNSGRRQTFFPPSYLTNRTPKCYSLEPLHTLCRKRTRFATEHWFTRPWLPGCLQHPRKTCTHEKDIAHVKASVGFLVMPL